MTDTERAAIEFQCASLCNAFAYHLDHREFEPLVQLFAEDGVFVRNGEDLRGQDAIRKAYAKRPPATTMHFVSNFHASSVSTHRVRSSVYNMVVHAMGVSAEPLIFNPASSIRLLDFADEFTLTPAGWRFASRNPRPVLQSTSWPG
jgi:hypothetical protein